MRKSAEKKICQHAIQWMKKAKEVIDFAHQIEASIVFGDIKPRDITKEVLVGSENNDYRIKRDWTKYESDLKSDFANTLKVNIVSYQIIVLKESYAALFVKGNPYGLKFAQKSSDPDLWAAQEILKQIRNALGHMRADKSGLLAQATWSFIDNNGKNKCPGRLEVACIGVILDTTDLQNVAFSWNQIGGIKNFNKILDYLIEDLSKK